jgi:hypothetical protein
MRIMWHLEMLLFSGWLDCSEWNTKFTPSDESREPRQKSYTANADPDQERNLSFLPPNTFHKPTHLSPSFENQLARQVQRHTRKDQPHSRNLCIRVICRATWNLVPAHQNKEHTSLPASRKTVRDIALR